MQTIVRVLVEREPYKYEQHETIPWRTKETWAGRSVFGGGCMAWAGSTLCDRRNCRTG